jgi:hypothetical protein
LRSTPRAYSDEAQKWRSPCGGQPPRPVRQPDGDRGGQPLAHRVATHPKAPAEVAVAPLRGQQRGVGIGPVVAELVAHIGQPPAHQRIDLVDRRHQPDLRPAAAAIVAAHQAATATLGQRHVTGRTLGVAIETGRFRAGGTVAVTVACTVDLADLSLLRVPGARTVTARFVELLDTFREVSLGFVNSEGSSAANSRAWALVGESRPSVANRGSSGEVVGSR